MSGEPVRSIEEIQRRYRGLMKPADALVFLLTPRRWACRLDRLGRLVGDAVVVDTTGPAQAVSRALGALSPLRSLLFSKSSVLQGLDWQARKSFWALTWSVTVALQRFPRAASIPHDERPISLLSAPETYSDFRAPTLVVPDDVPCAEQSLVADLAVETIHLLQDIYPIVASHQAVASNDPQRRLSETYTRVHRAVRTPPVWHADLVAAAQDDNLLGALAVGGPFAKLVERVSPQSDGYVIDLKHLGDYAVRDGLCQLGSEIRLVATDGVLRVSEIKYEGETLTPRSHRWEFVERIALAGLLTHLTVWRQGMEYHVGGLAPVPVATHNYLPAAHPLRRLLAAHMSQMLLTNRSTHVTLRRSGWDALALSFTREALLRYYDGGARAFDIRRLDVAADALRRGIPQTLNYPYLPQAISWYGLVESYVRSYVEHHYPDEAALEADTQANLWFEFLDRKIVNGVRPFVPSLTRDDLVRLCTLIIYSVSVAHSENSLQNYAVFMPTNVRRDGVAQSVGEVGLTVNFQFLITSNATLLLDPVSHLALDSGAAEIMDAFTASLRKLQHEMDARPSRYWHLYPHEVAASVSG